MFIFNIYHLSFSNKQLNFFKVTKNAKISITTEEVQNSTQRVRNENVGQKSNLIKTQLILLKSTWRFY